MLMRAKLMESQFFCNVMFFVYLSKVAVAQKLFPNAVWYEGSFGLIMAVSGCPGGYFWENGTRSELLTFMGRAVRCLNEKACHFYGHQRWCYPVVDTHYCVKVHPESLDPWPNGSYCFNMYRTCPRGFTEGAIYWDDHNVGADENTVSGTLPTGIFNKNTMFKYCCRSDGDASTPIRLPTSKPFHLYRYKGQCQQIVDMVVTEETVEFRTQQTFFQGNTDVANGTHPDCSLHPIVLHFCYYEKEHQPGPDPGSHECQPINPPKGSGCTKCGSDIHSAWMLLVFTMASLF